VFRRVKEAWDSKKHLLVDSGDNVIRQLAEALSTSTVSRELTEGLAQQALQLCASEVNFRDYLLMTSTCDLISLYFV